MRSRFTAFARGDAEYLSATWDPTTRPATIELDPERRWVHLEIVETLDGGPFAGTGEVEFRAHHRSPGGRGIQHERSRFVRHGGRWVYLDGVTR